MKINKRVENTVGKGEIAPYEQFLLFPQCFPKACILGASKGVIVWEWVKRRIFSTSRHTYVLVEPQPSEILDMYTCSYFLSTFIYYQVADLTLSRTRPGFYVYAV